MGCCLSKRASRLRSYTANSPDAMSSPADLGSHSGSTHGLVAPVPATYQTQYQQLPQAGVAPARVNNANIEQRLRREAIRRRLSGSTREERERRDRERVWSLTREERLRLESEDAEFKDAVSGSPGIHRL